jgi:dipeptidyl aminopeptidase/acylaminoacyl peptidase
MLGGNEDEMRAQASPLTYVSDSFPPTMFISGNADPIVNVEHSLKMYRALVDAGAKTELHVFEGQPHAFDREPAFGRQCAALMTLFLNRHVRATVAAAT